MKLLIIKCGAAGDVIRTTSLLPLIQAQGKTVSIDWLVEKKHSILLKGNSLINRIIEIDAQKGPDKTLADALAEGGYRIVYSLEESPEILAGLAGYEDAVQGFYLEGNTVKATPGAREYWEMSYYGPRPENDILKRKNKKTYLEHMCGIMGLTGQLKKPYIHLEKEIIAKAEKYFTEIRQPGRPVIGLNLGSGSRWKTKRLKGDSAVRLVESITEEGLTPLFFSGPDEVSESENPAGLLPGVSLFSNRPLEEFAAAVSLVDILVTTDTLALHIANAFGVPVIALFGPTSSEEIEFFGTGEKLAADMVCLCCYRKECGIIPSCMESIKTDIIITKIKELLYKQEK